MPSHYERDERVPPIHIRHYPAKSRQPKVPPESPEFVPQSKSPRVHDPLVDVSYQELVITSSIEVIKAEDDLEDSSSEAS